LKVYTLRARKREQDFTRNRKMTFAEIIFLMLGMVRESTQNALDRAFPRMGKAGTRISQQAFSAARQKIRWEALEELFRASVEGSLNEEMKLWRGFRVMAIDGTFLSLPSDAALLEHFGGLGHGATSPTALASLLYDLENDVILDARIAPVKSNERALAETHLQCLCGLPDFNLGRRELVIFDRGYPSRAIIKSMIDKEISFVIRAWKGYIPERDMRGLRDRTVELGTAGRPSASCVLRCPRARRKHF